MKFGGMYDKRKLITKNFEKRLIISLIFNKKLLKCKGLLLFFAIYYSN